jgi:Family of unknown function (DUF695)
MSFIKKLFGQKDPPCTSYAEFWSWFSGMEKEFHQVVKKRRNIEKDFFDKMSAKLNEVREGFLFLTGMYDEQTVELVFTADGVIRNFVFIEELVSAAPKLEGWLFTAHKPPMDNDNLEIRMGDFRFGGDNLFFYANQEPGYPDEIDISVLHTEMTEENKNELTNGIFIFLDNYLGELGFSGDIDNVSIITNDQVKEELIPIFKLKDFISWRKKEFIEKYDGLRYDTANDKYAILEAELKSGQPLLAVVNSSLLQWEGKASHPWMAVLTIKYDGSNNNGMPREEEVELLNKMEDEIMLELTDADGYLNIGRQTAAGERELYFACRDFRKPAKVLASVATQYEKRFEIKVDIFKDKYWRSVEHFSQQ